MDTRNSNDILQARELVDRMMKRVNTAIPGRIDDFDPATQTCTVTPAIKNRVYVDGVSAEMELPQLFNVPLVFPFAVSAGFALTIPVAAGDPCILIFNQRCIDNWHQNGGIQPPEESAVGARHHDMNDGVAMLCAPPLTDVLGSWCSDGIEIRDRSRSTRVTVKDGAVEIEAGSISTKGLLKHEGDLETTGAASIGMGASGVFTANGKAVTVQNGIIVGIV